MNSKDCHLANQLASPYLLIVSSQYHNFVPSVSTNLLSTILFITQADSIFTALLIPGVYKTGSVTTGSVTTGSVTTGSVTTGSVTTGSVTTGSVTTGSVT
ncbi:hypothetical protein HOG27_05220, partial [bacterium]|nr:hypothetical protein [bacterium]